MKASKVFFAVGFIVSCLVSGQALASNSGRVRTNVQFVNENGQVRSGQLDLFVVQHGDGTAHVSDITAQGGSRSPIALRSGLIETSYMFQKNGNSERVICNAAGYTYGVLTAITAHANFGTRYSDATLVTDNSGNLQAAGDLNQPSVSMVKCCKSLPCQD